MEPEHRIGRYAQEAYFKQWVDNLIRRLTFRKILKTPQEAYDEVIEEE